VPATSFGAFALLLAALLLPAFQSLQLYAGLPCCPDDCALRRHIHLIPPQYSRTEEERLQYLKRSRAIQTSAFENTPRWPAADLIRYKIPASFMGSQAWASDQVADALALARELGPPCFFITMTSNPKWPEIVERLQPGQHFTDIPSVVCRTFHVRLQYLKAFMTHHFGRVVYIVTVVEFQNRTQFRFHTASDGSTCTVVDDEFHDYISGRYLSSSEAVYRIFSFNITSKRPAIRCLPCTWKMDK
jgi:hypothetical protein